MGNGVSGEMSIFADGELEAELKRLNGSDDMSLKKFVKKSYDDVIQMVIRPPRALYDIDELGPVAFSLPIASSNSSTSDSSVVHVQREDFSVLNDRDLKVLGSHWRLFASPDSPTPLSTPCLIYLHSNLGSRVDALRIRDHALARGLSVVAFDFSGSGRSDGVYVTMGWNEARDFHSVLMHHLESDPSVTDLVVFAHSMGTFPAIVSVASRSLALGVVHDRKVSESLNKNLPAPLRLANVNALAKPIRGLVLDGAYASMDTLTRELMQSVQTEGFAIPTPLLQLACRVVEQSVKKRADTTLDKLRPIEYVKVCAVPALFLVGRDDRYVAPSHSEQLAAQYAGPATVCKVDGEHYTLREARVYCDAVEFLVRALQK